MTLADTTVTISGAPDVCFVIALLLCLAAAIWYGILRSWPAAFTAAALGFVATAFLLA